MTFLVCAAGLNQFWGECLRTEKKWLTGNKYTVPGIPSGQKGTKRLLEKYGDALLCIRFRYDEKAGKRLKTVELIEEQIDWTPPPPRYAPDTLVPLRVAASDMTLRAKVKAAGGK